MANEKPDKLSQEVSMAIAAGMSYGKWKASQPVVQPVAVDKMETADGKPKKTLVCPHCKKVFVPNMGNQRFCEPFCQKEDYKERQRKEKQKRKGEVDEKRKTA